MTFTFDRPQRIRRVTIYALYQTVENSTIYPFNDVTINFWHKGNSVLRNKLFRWNGVSGDWIDSPLPFTIDVEDLWAKEVTLDLRMGNYSKKLALSEVTFIGGEQ